MARDIDRRRNFLKRLKSAPVLAAGAASVVGLAAWLAKPMSVEIGDITFPGIVVASPTIFQILLSGGAPVLGATVSAAGVASVTVNTVANIYAHSFEDDTDGDFTRNGSQGILVADGGVWTVVADAPTGGGSKSVRATIPVSAGNYGAALIKYAIAGAPRSAFYVRFAAKWESNFNFSDDHKVNRAQDGIGVFGNHGSFLTENGGGFWWYWDDFGGDRVYANTNLPAPNANDLRGSWHWYQIYRNISNPDAMLLKIWIDGILYWDYTFDAPNPETDDYYDNQFFGTFNSVATEADVWLDHIGYSTQQMGMP